MGLFSRKKKEPVADKPIQQELIACVDSLDKAQIADDYIKNTILPNYRVQYEKAKAVMGVIFLAERDNDKAKSKYDSLIKFWIDQIEISEEYDKPPHIACDVAFFNGLLAANQVVTEQEFNEWNQKYMEMAEHAEDRFLNRVRECFLKSDHL